MALCTLVGAVRERLKCPRPLALVASLVGVVVIASVVSTAVIPPFVEQFSELIQQLPRAAELLLKLVHDSLVSATRMLYGTSDEWPGVVEAQLRQRRSAQHLSPGQRPGGRGLAAAGAGGQPRRRSSAGVVRRGGGFDDRRPTRRLPGRDVAVGAFVLSAPLSAGAVAVWPGPERLDGGGADQFPVCGLAGGHRPLPAGGEAGGCQCCVGRDSQHHSQCGADPQHHFPDGGGSAREPPGKRWPSCCSTC
jgi:hypothetical protein